MKTPLTNLLAQTTPIGRFIFWFLFSLVILEVILLVIYLSRNAVTLSLVFIFPHLITFMATIASFMWCCVSSCFNLKHKSESEINMALNHIGGKKNAKAGAKNRFYDYALFSVVWLVSYISASENSKTRGFFLD